jgi:hypothetical protein
VYVVTYERYRVRKAEGGGGKKANNRNTANDLPTVLKGKAFQVSRNRPHDEIHIRASCMYSFNNCGFGC